jgi:MoaA/NifB/PqqE/SkfB family radical SAM enzyme
MISKTLRLIENFAIATIGTNQILPIQIDITNACNLRCSHCYHSDHNNSGALIQKEWEKILNDYKNLILKYRYSPTVIICGGEPLSSPLIVPLVEFISKNIPKSPVSILTNGTLVNKNFLQKIHNFKNIRFQVSIDGPDEKSHNFTRGNGAFSRSLLGIQNLIGEGYKVNVLAVLSRKNMTQIEDFFRLAKEQQFTSMNFTRFIAKGSGESLAQNKIDRPLEALELKAAFTEIIRCMNKYRVPSRVQSPLFDLLASGLGLSGNYWQAIIIDYQGNMVASSRSKIKLGNVLSGNMEDLFISNPIYQSLKKGNVEGCGSCSKFSFCGGDRNAAYAHSGNFLGRDPGCWLTDNKIKQGELA